MHQHTKTSYHPYLLVAFYLNCLPKNILQIIPRSTRYDWNHRVIQDSFGYDWFFENKDLFHTLEMVAINKKLLKINKAFIRVIPIIRFMKENAAAIRTGRILMKAIVVRHI